MLILFSQFVNKKLSVKKLCLNYRMIMIIFMTGGVANYWNDYC